MGYLFGRFDGIFEARARQLWLRFPAGALRRDVVKVSCRLLHGKRKKTRGYVKGSGKERGDRNC